MKSERMAGGSPRVLFYSHDTYGLGHLRRSRALATAITQANSNISALILTGSPVAGRFPFPDNVDHIRLPGVTKTPDGNYESERLGLHIDETTALRAGLIKAAVEHFDPDMLIVDKEPTGFRGELLPALEWLKLKRKAHLVLGLRDVLDEPKVLAEEWDRKGAREAAERYYDETWVYGLRSIYDPTAGLDLSQSFRSKMKFTGYLHREALSEGETPEQPYVLVTPGGGGDGAGMIDLVLSAYETDPDLAPRALLVYGPFLSVDSRAQFEARVAKLDGRVQAVGFESRMETLMKGATGIVSMGGYNTFCEVLSFDKPVVIVPRTRPRMEQYIRASRAEDLGLVRMLDETRDGFTPEAMIAAIRALPDQPKPSHAFVPGLLNGLDVVSERTLAMLGYTKSQGAA
ncbi:glycosyltransferase family protein [Shimia marina]|uniref:Undecaprenyldiphospho-muramoylpentapeptide beta-N-acetylglucosaminyltransferase n=1 Tax=Shimia marina TaxID=321267 RepID=A0A0P1ELV6_9RHOB|nr:glycosyltransferase [Shimia marina]CUH51242.1 undecaprenyldiphospho-muramoylpentapeptide beta-N-acetylglucosaminyltransferase [Shimia marina]SFD54208.1 Predicted glycosyl transferase [Shimia marina]